jgi:hypothetical protein
VDNFVAGELEGSFGGLDLDSGGCSGVVAELVLLLEIVAGLLDPVGNAVKFFSPLSSRSRVRNFRRVVKLTILVKSSKIGFNNLL